MWIGLDIGTSAVKAVLVDDSSAVVAEAVAQLDISRPQPLWVEQEPDSWWQACRSAICALPADLRARVRGLGLSGQMHGAVLLGNDGRPLRPAILWNDGRAYQACLDLEKAVPNSRSITGNIAMPGFTAPKLLWVREHEPEVFARIAKILLPKDYVRLCLTGDYASDMSDSAGTLWLDVAARCWSATMLYACGLDERAMPSLFEGSQSTGLLRTEIASELGLPRVPVAAGGGDNAAGAVGVGAIAPGDALLSLGTSGVIFAVSDGFQANIDRAVHSFCHALPARWHQMAVILSAAACLDWATKLGGFASVAVALEAAEAVDDKAIPVFLPYLSGERTPHNNPNASGVLFGMTHDSDGAAVVRAVLEGVAFALADGADALRATGMPLTALNVIGGGSRSPLWGRILAASLGARLEYRQGANVGPAMGAARLGRLAVTGESPENVCMPGALVDTIAPDAALADSLAPRRAQFQRLYPALRQEFSKRNTV